MVPRSFGAQARVFKTQNTKPGMDTVGPAGTTIAAIQDAVNIVNDQSRIKFSKNVKTLNSKHMKLIVEELGTAEGYEELKSEGV